MEGGMVLCVRAGGRFARDTVERVDKKRKKFSLEAAQTEASQRVHG
jgi:hypothetical protein